MKKTFLIIGLILQLFNTAFSQQRSYSYSLPEHGLSLFNDSVLAKMPFDSLLSTVKPSGDYAYHALPELIKRYSVEDKMPCIVPKGNYSGLMVTPDSTNRCKILIIKP